MHCDVTPCNTVEWTDVSEKLVTFIIIISVYSNLCLLAGILCHRMQSRCSHDRAWDWPTDLAKVWKLCSPVIRNNLEKCKWRAQKENENKKFKKKVLSIQSNKKYLISSITVIICHQLDPVRHFRPRLIFSSKVYQVVFINLLYNWALFLTSCCCSLS